MTILHFAAVIIASGGLLLTVVAIIGLVWFDLVRELIGRRSPLKFLRRPRYRLQHAAAVVLATCVLTNIAANMDWSGGKWVVNVAWLGFCAIGLWLLICLAVWMYEDFARPWRRRSGHQSLDGATIHRAIADRTRFRRRRRLRIRLPDIRRQTTAFKRF